MLGCTSVPRWYRSLLFGTLTWNPLPLMHSYFYTSFNTDINIIIQSSPYHQNVIIWCLMSSQHTPMISCSFWWECLCMCLVGMLSGYPHLEMPKQMFSFSLCRVGNCSPQAHAVTLSLGYFEVPLCWASQGTIYLQHIKSINCCRNVQLKWMVNTFKTWVCKID